MGQQIVLCMGLPGSGKSTWAKQFCTDHPEFERINKDDVRTAMGNPSFSSAVEKTVLAKEHLEGIIILDSGKSLIVDDTNFSPKHWEYWFRIASDRGIDIQRKIFDVPTEECIRRDLLREKPVGRMVIMSMYNKYLKSHIYG